VKIGLGSLECNKKSGLQTKTKRLVSLKLSLHKSNAETSQHTISLMMQSGASASDLLLGIQRQDLNAKRRSVIEEDKLKEHKVSYRGLIYI
jgi:hypothetical protein